MVATFGAKLMSKLKVLPNSNLEQLFLHFPPLQSVLIPFNPKYLGSGVQTGATGPGFYNPNKNTEYTARKGLPA